MHNVDESLCGQVIDARYSVEYCIGRGGMGVVWRVRHVQTRQLFALKTLRSHAAQNRDMLRRLLQEARATAAVQSRNVVRVVDVKPDYVHQGSELPFIVMELLEGQSFSEVLESRGTIEPAELVWVMQQVSRGLSLAHRRGIIHRDLKPSNVFLARDGDGDAVVKLCDFGIAKLQGSALIDLAETGTLATETGVVFGTPRYMAPEQLRRAGREGPETDQWAFALIAFRALSGQGYFESARNVAELILAIVHEPLPVPSNVSPLVPAAFDDWFLRSCSRDPEHRFPDSDSQQSELEQALGTPAPQAIELPERSPTISNPRLGEARKLDSNARPLSEASQFSQPQWKRILTSPFYWGLGAALGFAVVSTSWLHNSLQPRPTMMQSSPGASTVGSTPTEVTQKPASADTSQPKVEQPAPGPLPSLLETAPPASVSAKHSTVPRSHVDPKGPETSKRPAAPALLGRGSACTRSSQCTDGLCAAEVCQ